jgi:hypothetical protein
MAKQLKPFIVEIKPSRKLKAGSEKTSIWGKLDLKPGEPDEAEMNSTEKPIDLAAVDRS